MRRFEFIDSKSNKFWEISRSASTVTVRFGKNGTDGQSQTKTYASESEAVNQHDKQIAEKLKKGYLEIAESSGRDFESEKPVAKFETKPLAKKTNVESGDQLQDCQKVKVDRLPAAFDESSADPIYLKGFKSSLAKRFSLSNSNTLYEAVDLAIYLLALEREEEAMQIVTHIASNITFSGNFDIWSPAATAIAIRSRLLFQSGEQEAARAAIGPFVERPGFVIPGMELVEKLGMSNGVDLAVKVFTSFLRESVTEIEKNSKEESTKWACHGLSRTLMGLINKREAIRYHVRIPQWLNIDAAIFENTIENALQKLKQRLNGEKPPIDGSVQKAKANTKAGEDRLEKARELAWQGNFEEASKLLEQLAGADIEAALLLMRIDAYQERWHDVLSVLERIIDGAALCYWNSHHLKLAARAAYMTGDRTILARIAAKQRAKLSAHGKPIPALVLAMEDFAAHRDSEVVMDHVSNIFKRTASTAAPVQEFLDDMKTLPRRMPPYARKDPEFILSYSFSSAFKFRQLEEMRRLYTNNESLRNWSHATQLARVTAALGDPEAAWQLIKSSLSSWMSFGEVVPTELAVDEDFRAFITPEQMLEILRTPRRPKGQSAMTKGAEPVKLGGGPVKKFTVRLVSSAQPIVEKITKFGGQPVWLEEAQWPVSVNSGKPMSFIGQIKLEPSVFGNIEAQMAYIFVASDEDFDNGAGLTFDDEAGDNAVIIQPRGRLPTYVEALKEGKAYMDKIELERKILPVEALSEGPTYCADLRAELILGEDEPHQIDGQDDDVDLDAIAEIKIGGTPVFFEHEEYPKGGASEWKLLLQMGDEVMPGLNFGMGYAYAFISKDGKEGKLLIQTG